jgi:3'-phosphoadenosine 5'-phosphosulfate sulfotransferase (PAPS reductase)/FAD synthetase
LDRLNRRRIVTLDVPLLEIQYRRNDIHVTPLIEGEIQGMDIEAFLTVNQSRLNQLVEVTKSFADFELKQAKNALIAFSGGKDSIVLADILNEFHLPKVFIDTRLEFPETYSFISALREDGFQVDITKAYASFFQLVNQYGFPKHGDRWCCKSQKFGPFSRYLTDKYGDQQVLVFSAERRCEGLYRMSEPLKRQHRYIQTQITIQPLLDWLTLDVWNYIWTKKLLVNPIYKYFDRAGCWLCPFGLEYRIFLLQFTHPKLYKTLEKLRGDRKRAITVSDKQCLVENSLNWGKISKADGIGKAIGSCGDIMEVYIKLRNSRITKAKFQTSGCNSSIMCGEAITELVKKKDLRGALKITPQDVLNKVGKIPEKETHCSFLAVDAFKRATEDFLSRKGKTLDF